MARMHRAGRYVCGIPLFGPISDYVHDFYGFVHDVCHWLCLLIALMWVWQCQRNISLVDMELMLIYAVEACLTSQRSANVTAEALYFYFLTQIFYDLSKVK